MDEVTCSAKVDAFSAPYVGEAKGGKDDDVTEMAQAQACEALKKDHAVECDDPEKVVRSTSSTFSMTNGEVSKSARIELRAVVATVAGEAKSDGYAEACRAAAAAACKKAPAGSTCEAAWLSCKQEAPRTYTCERRWRIASEPSLFGS